MTPARRATALRFWKMSGSGNDFVFFDARAERLDAVRGRESVARLCDRRRGVGADGVVLLEAASGPGASFRMVYFNSDGSRASMCGNAALCSTRLATELGAGDAGGFVFESDAGEVAARLRDGLPEVDLTPVTDLVGSVDAVARDQGEERVGYAVVGVPHLVVLTADAGAVALPARGPALRAHPSLGAAGANANFVSRDAAGRWSMRTFERGVEGETLACGTGAVASAALIRAWGMATSEAVELTTRSGLPLEVRFAATADRGAVQPSLRGEGRIVFTGELREL